MAESRAGDPDLSARQLREDVELARAELRMLIKEIAAAQQRLLAGENESLIEANEQLVLSWLRSQSTRDALRHEASIDRRLGQCDPLTGLPNRLLFLDRFAQSIDTARRKGGRLAVLSIDLDDFHQVNDLLGHAYGDGVLRHVARCLGLSVRGVDTVSRQGGDEFVVLLSDLAVPADAGRVAAKVLDSLASPALLGEHVIRIAASIGISIFPDDGEVPETLVQLADAAMFQAKRQGWGTFVFHDAGAPEGGPARAVPWRPRAGVASTTTLARQDVREAQLQEANEHLLLAALGAQELQSAAELAHDAQSARLAVVAHELRNPLTPIRTAAALMSRVPPSELPRLQAVIERQIHHVVRLIGDLLDLSRFDTGKLRLEIGRADLLDLVHVALDACRPAMQARAQQLLLTLPPAPVPVEVDPVRLVQVLSNLLDNASKYTPAEGSIELVVRLADAFVEVTVIDNGIGISADALADVFKPFVQDPHATNFNGAGLGIGLAVVRQLIEAHGGEVHAHSAGRGQGSRFVFTLALAKD